MSVTVDGKEYILSSRGLCAICKHRYSCPLSTVYVYEDQEFDSGCRITCSGETVMSSGFVIKHKKFQLDPRFRR